MNILDAKSKKIGILSAAAVSALVIFTGCNGPTIMENRDGVPSAKRELGYQKDNSLPGNISQATEKNNNFDTGLVANDENSSIKETSFTPDKKDEAEFYAVEFPRMEDMSKKTVGPKKETPTAKVSASGEYYVVVKGDSVGSIAKKFKVKRADLIAVNNISNPNQIRIGQKLKLPSNANVSARGENTSTKTVSSSDAVVNGLYTVKPNDSISKIAKKLKITRASLMQANNLNENSILRIGQKLVIPNAQSTVTATEETSSNTTTTATTTTTTGISEGEFDDLTKQLDNEANSTTVTESPVVTAVTETTPVTTTTTAVEVPATYTAEQDTKLEDICKKYNLNINDVKILNSHIEADNIVKAGATVFLQ